MESRTVERKFPARLSNLCDAEKRILLVWQISEDANVRYGQVFYKERTSIRGSLMDVL